MSKLYNVDIIVEYIKNNNLTKKEFAKQCKISTSTLYKVLQGKHIYVKTLWRVVKVIGIEFHQIFKDCD